MTYIDPYRSFPQSNRSNEEDFLARDNGHSNFGDQKDTSGKETQAELDQQHARKKQDDNRAQDQMKFQSEESKKSDSHKNSLSLAMRSDDFQNRLKNSGKERENSPHSRGKKGILSLFSAKNKEEKDTSKAGEHQVLAVHAGSNSTIPLLTSIQQPSPSIPTLPLSIQELVSRVEQAIRAELYTSPGGVHNFSITLGSTVNGINAVMIRMSPSGLDVILSGNKEITSAIGVHAAQALTDRLSKRFSNKTIRVLATDRAGNKGSDTSPDETTEISETSERRSPVQMDRFV